MKVGIVGSGAMGSVYAGLLGRAGNEVWVIDTWQDHIDAIAGDGLTVSGASGWFTVDTLRTGRLPHDAGPCDLWVIGTKASAVEEVAAGIAPLLRPDDVVMAFQNGLGRANGSPVESRTSTWSSASLKASARRSLNPVTCTMSGCA